MNERYTPETFFPDMSDVPPMFPELEWEPRSPFDPILCRASTLFHPGWEENHVASDHELWEQLFREEVTSHAGKV